MTAHISLIIPSRNEEQNLNKIVPGILKAYGKKILEVIIVNDCSSDKTKAVAIKLQKKFPKIKIVNRTGNPGVGNAIREGLNHLSSNSSYVLLMDCDFLANIPDIQKMIDKISEDHLDGVVGSRFINKDSLQNYPKIKLAANRTFHFLTKIFLGIPHSDLTNNFKLYHMDLIQTIRPMLKSSNFAVNAELGYYPVLLGYKIGQIPVLWKERSISMGISKFKIFRVGHYYFLIFLYLIYLSLKLSLSKKPRKNIGSKLKYAEKQS